MDSGTIYIETKCKNTKDTFYVKYSKGADGVWVLLRGEKQLSDNEKRDITNRTIDISQSRMSPRYACPYCGNTGFIECASCKRITCYDGQNSTAYCAHCKIDLKISGTLKSLKGDGTKGQ